MESVQSGTDANGSRFMWGINDFSLSSGIGADGFDTGLYESSEEWLGTDKINTPKPEYGNQLHNDVDNTGFKLHKISHVGDAEESSLKKYTENGYKAINELHRTGKISNLNLNQVIGNHDDNVKANLDHTKNIDSLISRHTTEMPIHVWRGISKDAIKKLSMGKKGDIISDKGFVSTTAYPAMAKHVSRSWNQSDHIIHIKVPKGSKAIHVPSHTMTIAGENEVLLPRNSKFHYDGKTVEKDSNGTSWKIHHLTHIPE